MFFILFLKNLFVILDFLIYEVFDIDIVLSFIDEEVLIFLFI